MLNLALFVLAVWTIYLSVIVVSYCVQWVCNISDDKDGFLFSIWMLALLLIVWIPVFAK